MNHVHVSISPLASTVDYANCSTGDVTFIDFTDDETEGSRQGTLQICINNAWGSVCSDNFYDTTDAVVFCDQLVGFNTTGNKYINLC